MTVQNSQAVVADLEPIKVGVVVLDGFAMMSFSAAVEPLRAANRLAEKNLYDVSFIGKNSVVQSSSGAFVETSLTIGAQESFDWVLVITGSDVAGTALAEFSDVMLFRWLRRLAQHAFYMGGVSGGPAILAKAGLMNNRRMTIHWDHAETLAAAMPELLLERSVYVRDRDRLTCAGGIAPLDMMHTLISEYQGPEFARLVSDWFLHTDIRGASDPQKSGIAERYNVHSKPLQAVIELMENHIADPLDLDQLASVASLSPRQLNRLFREKLNLSTIAFYRQLRLEKGRGLLQQSALSVSDIAEATGFVDSAHFGRCFRQAFDCKPSDVRSGVDSNSNES